MHSEHSSCEVDGDEAELRESSSCLAAAIATSAQERDGYFWIEVGDVKEKLAERNIDCTGECASGDFFLFANIDEDGTGVDDLAPSKDWEFRRWGSLCVDHGT
jgi:hypothetical protein